MTVWTIGHSTRTLGDFIGALRSQKVAVVADVRSMPGSRRYPHFDQAPLSAALRAEGMGYEHFPQFGGRRKPRPDSRNTVWRLWELATRKRSVILCAEAVWWRCHASSRTGSNPRSSR